MKSNHLIWMYDTQKILNHNLSKELVEKAELLRDGVRVPFGFVLSHTAHSIFLEKTKLLYKFKSIIPLINYDLPSEVQQAAKHLQKLVRSQQMPKSLIDDVATFYEYLYAEEEQFFLRTKNPLTYTLKRLRGMYSHVPVRVQGDVVNVDSPKHFDLHSSKFIKGEAALIHQILNVWSSAYSETNLRKMQEFGIQPEDIRISVFIQKELEPEKSGLAFSSDPINNDKKQMIIEAVLGDGKGIQKGTLIPDHYRVAKDSFAILEKTISKQSSKYFYNNGDLKAVPLPDALSHSQKLTDNEIRELAIAVRKIEQKTYFPQEVSWSIHKGRLYVTDIKPLNILSEKPLGNSEARDILLKGYGAAPGTASGMLHIAKTQNDLLNLNTDHILVVESLQPADEKRIAKAKGIIMSKGGYISYGAAQARELGIPAVVGVEEAFKKLKSDMVVTLNGNTGEIFKGGISTRSDIHTEVRHTIMKQTKSHAKKSNSTPFKTTTKVMIKVNRLEEDEILHQQHHDGIGLFSSDFVFDELNIHPREYVKQNKQHLFVKKLKKMLKDALDKNETKPLYYRPSDHTSRQLRQFSGGILHELEEVNPSLGLRGASKYIAYPEVFHMELQALKELVDAGYHSLRLLIPFVRVPWELIKIEAMIQEAGLRDNQHFETWMMVEVPSAATMIDEFLDIGVSGVMVDALDLSMLMLGVDAFNDDISYLFDERHPAVLTMLNTVVQKCSERGIKTALTGTSATDYPEVVEKLLSSGLDILVVEPHAVNRSRAMVFELERRVHVKN